jgi:acyl-coenzyme A synthetase/AMP-(fatty) acid ligase
LKELLKLSKASYIIAHPFNLDIALEAAAMAGIPPSRVWSIQKDPKNRAPFWKDLLVRDEEASPVKLTIEQSKNSLAYLCFSSGTTG